MYGISGKTLGGPVFSISWSSTRIWCRGTIHEYEFVSKGGVGRKVPWWGWWLLAVICGRKWNDGARTDFCIVSFQKDLLTRTCLEGSPGHVLIQASSADRSRPSPFRLRFLAMAYSTFSAHSHEILWCRTTILHLLRLQDSTLRCSFLWLASTLISSSGRGCNIEKELASIISHASSSDCPVSFSQPPAGPLQ